jgi:uncharacterized protein (TIGR02145 family)
MKKLTSFLPVIAAAFVFASCDDATDVTAVTGIELSETASFLSPSAELQLEATILPAQATDKTVSWKSSDETVAIVDDGVVTALKDGSATITAITNDGEFEENCDITVNWLGQTSFKTGRTWDIYIANGTQTWSDGVMAAGCKKDEFYGGLAETTTYLCDCRQNVDDYADLFSWATIDEYADQLCPDGWRVPTPEDFVELSKALGGTGEEERSETLFNSFQSTWGAELGGTCNYAGQLTLTGKNTIYWAQYDNKADLANALTIYTAYFHIRPGLAAVNRSYGAQLRCVK